MHYKRPSPCSKCSVELAYLSSKDLLQLFSIQCRSSPMQCLLPFALGQQFSSQLVVITNQQIHTYTDTNTYIYGYGYGKPVVMPQGRLSQWRLMCLTILWDMEVFTQYVRICTSRTAVTQVEPNTVMA